MKPLQRQHLAECLLVVALLASAGALRWWAFETGRTEFDGDEAITGLMAKDIWLGRDTPIFFSDQAYAGSAESYATALVFAARGRADVVGSRLVGTAFAALGLLFFYGFVRWAAGPLPALAALALLTFAPGFITVWSIKQRGGYLLLAPLSVAILWSAMVIDEGRRNGRVSLLAAMSFGLSVGLGWWTHRSVAFAIGAVLAVVVWRLFIDAIHRGRHKRLVARVALVNVTVLFFVYLDRPIPLDVLDDSGFVVRLSRLSSIFVIGILLVAMGELSRVVSRPGVWAIGVVACLVGYGPVLVFIANGGQPTTPFELASVATLAANVKELALTMGPRFLGLDGLLTVDETSGALVGAIVLAMLAGVALSGGIGASLLQVRNDSRRAAFVRLMTLWAVVALPPMLISAYTSVSGGEPRHVLTSAYALAALCGVGWSFIFARRKQLLPAACALCAIHGVSSLIALPPQELNADRMPVRYEAMMEYLNERGVTACYVMDHTNSRGYWPAMEWTFYCDERILFAPPTVSNRLPRLSEAARRHRPAVWVSRFPVDLIESSYTPYFKKPLDIIDLGDARVVTSDETERMCDIVYNLSKESWYH